MVPALNAVLDLVIREAQPADLGPVVALLADDMLGAARESPGDPAYEAAFDAMRAQGGNLLLVAVQGGTVIGCLQMILIPGISHRGATRAELEGVRVASAARGQGIGGALVDAAIERAREAGCRLVQLTTNKARVDAQRFYLRRGFAPSHVGMKLDLAPPET